GRDRFQADRPQARHQCHGPDRAPVRRGHTRLRLHRHQGLGVRADRHGHDLGRHPDRWHELSRLGYHADRSHRSRGHALRDLHQHAGRLDRPTATQVHVQRHGRGHGSRGARLDQADGHGRRSQSQGMSLALADLPTGRQAPPEIVRALKEVDPTAELVYMGDRRWDLLRLRPKNDARAKVAFGMLMNAYRACEKGRLAEAGWYRALRFARLLRQGYIVFGRYQLERDPDARIVHEFRRALWEYTHDRNDQEIE